MGLTPWTSQDDNNATHLKSARGAFSENDGRGSIPETFTALPAHPGKARSIGWLREREPPAIDPGSPSIDHHIPKG